MTNEQQTLLLIKGTIASLPADQQQKVAECADQLRKLMADNPPHGLMAVALVGAELAAE